MSDLFDTKGLIKDILLLPFTFVRDLFKKKPVDNYPVSKYPVDKKKE